MPTSWEASYARRMAFFYKHRELLQHSRADRVAAIKREVEELEEAIKSDRATHEAHCSDCRQHQFCMRSLEISPHWDTVRERLTLLAKEEADEKYAEKARQARPENHCDGFTAYWQNLRFRRFALADFKCETCGAPATDLHHHHYDTFGFEELDDVQALCRECHSRHHERSSNIAARQRKVGTAYLLRRAEARKVPLPDPWPDEYWDTRRKNYAAGAAPPHAASTMCSTGAAIP